MIPWARGHWQLFLLVALVFAFWTSWPATPLRLLVVFFHELSHAIAVVLTGGRVESLTVSPMEGGAVLSRGGNRFLSLSAGYLGSLLIGAGLFLAAVQSRADRAVAGAMGVFLLVFTLIYLRDLFTIVLAGAAALILLGAAWKLPAVVSDFLLRVVGLTSMVYVPFDIWSDTIARAHLRSDARMLAEEFGGPTVLWGGLWLILSLVVILAVFRATLRQPSNITLGG